MPTPIGHALAGLAIGWSAESLQKLPTASRGRPSLVMICGGLAILPDADLIYLPIHRTLTHSVIAAVIAGLVCGYMLRRVPRVSCWQIAGICALAYGSHIGLDWLGGDTKLPAGVQLLSPVTDQWFISSWNVFLPTHLGGFFTPPVILANVTAMVREVLILGPFALVAWTVRCRTQRAGLNGVR